MESPLIQTRSQALSVARNISIIIGVLMVAFAAVAACMLLFGLYTMAKTPEQFGLLQLVLESISRAESLFQANVEGRQVIANISHTPLYLILLLVLGLLVSSVASMVGAFGSLGVSLLRLSAEIEHGRPLRQTQGTDTSSMSSLAKSDLSVK